MLKKTTVLLLICAAFSTLSAQNIPVIKATSAEVAVRDAGQYQANAWTLAPEIKPDVYYTSSKNKRVTFYTDLDSISTIVKPGKPFRFIIRLNDTIDALTEIAYQASYLEVLAASSKYSQQNATVPAFTYQSMDAPELKAIREGLRLDSIAGTGNEVSRILNLLHWIHNLVPHDGQHNNPEVKNALSMIEVCKKDKRGLNCRGLATVLNECYLSLGIPSRFVTCLPRDSNDTECHVINMVFSKELDKWIWIDPTHDAYIMDEKGNLLGLEEVRERLIAGKTLILNPDANWNHKESTLKAHYLEVYMAKNLYRFECPVESRYDTETAAKGKKVEYIQLLPIDAYYPNRKSTTLHRPSGVSITTHYIDNPRLFWAKPQR